MAQDAVFRAIYSMGVTGVQSVEQADASLGRLAVTEEKVARAHRSSEETIKRMGAQYSEAVRAMRTYENAVDKIQRLEADGVGTSAQREALLDAATAKYTRMREAIIGTQEALAKMAREERAAQQAATAQQALADRFGIGGAVKSARESAGVFAAELEKMEEIASQKAMQIGQAFQAGLNQHFGIGAISKSAKESASVFAAELDRLDDIAAQKAAQIGQTFQASLNASFGIGATGKFARDSAAVFTAELDRLDELASQKAQQIGRNFQDQLNRSFNIGGPSATSRGATFSALEEQFERMEMIAQEKARHIAEVTQRGIADAFGVGKVSKSARDSAAAFEEVARAEDEAAAAAARLRAAINPLEAEMGRIGKEMAQYRALLHSGRISQEEFTQFQAVAGKRLHDFGHNLKNAGTAGRLMAGEMANLSFQLNDVITGIALGQSPFMILAQQGGQVYQILANSRGGVAGSIKELGSLLGSIITPARLAFAGIVSGALAAAVATNDYLSSQQKVAMALTGSGRASGASVGGINAIAGQGSSMFGLSVSEARELAAALAGTGRIANDNILPIVQMGKDIAHAFGVEAADATKLLSDAFSEPSKGAETLNQRLGFLDASTKRNIDNLVAQNRAFEAQKILLDGVKSGLEGVDAAVSKSTKGWTAIANAVSNAWDALGRITARALNLENLDPRETIKRLDDQISSLRARSGSAGIGDWIGGGNDEAANNGELQRAIELRERMAKALQKQAEATARAQAAQRSFAQESAVRNALPEIAAVEGLSNSLKVLEDLLQSLSNDEGAGDRLRQLGLTFEQIAKSVDILRSNIRDFKNEFAQNSRSLEIANQAITAYSPGGKGAIARENSLLSTSRSTLSDIERQTLATKAQENAIKTATEAMREQNRERRLAANQAVEFLTVEIDLVGKGIAQQVEARANEQARQALQQMAAQNRVAFDDAEYERLKRINAELGKKAQLRAITDTTNRVQFDIDTSFFTNEERRIAQELQQIFGNKWKDNMDSAIANQMRLNDLLKSARDTAVSFAQDFVQGLMSGKSVMESLGNAARNLSSQLANSAITNLFSGNFIGAAVSGVGALVTGLFGNSQKKKQEQQQAWQQAMQRAEEFQFRASSAGLETDTRRGSLAAMELRFQQERLAEARAGGQAMAALLDAQRAEILAVNRDWDQRELKALEEKRAQALARQQEFHDRVFAATNNGDTLRGALAAFDREADRERFDELRSGGEAINDLEAALVAERLNIIKDFIEQAIARQLDYQDRLFAATNDSSTLSGALAAFDREAERERIEELRDGGAAIKDLEAALFAERLNIVKDFNERAAEEQERANEEQLRIQERQNEEARRAAQELLQFVQGISNTIQSYLDNLQTGAQSTLDPQGRLGAAQSQFDEQLALALTGNRDALQSITNYAGTLLSEARSFYASGEGYDTIYDAVTAGLNQAKNISPDVVAENDALLAAVNATTEAALATKIAVLTGTSTTVSSLDASLDANTNATLTAIGDSASTTSTAIGAGAGATATAIDVGADQTTSNIAVSNTILGGLNILTDRIINALNGLGDLQADIGTGHDARLVAIHTAIVTSGSGGGGSGTIWSWFGFQKGGVIPGYAGGGMVGNGLTGIDSVRARYAGGGEIMLAGKEGILTSWATQSIGGAPAIDFINRFGRFPSNDNANNDNFRMLAQTNANGFSAVVNTLREELAEVRREFRNVRDELVRERNRPKQPGRVANG